jgi:hypothetical protein
MQPGCDQDKTTEGVTTTAPNGTAYWAIIATHRRPAGARLRDKAAEAGFFASQDFLDLDYGVSKQREGGITLSMASNGGEVIDGRGKTIYDSARSFFDALPHPRNQFVLTTEDQEARMHGQRGNSSLLHQIAFRWLDEIPAS